MKRTLLQWLAGTAVAAIALSTPAWAEQIVKVGMVLSLSGPTASLGENILHGAELYLETHKSELPKDVKIEILRRDDTGPNPDVAKRLAQELIVRDHVQMLGGVVFTPNAAAIAPLATQSKTPLVLMNASTSKLTRQSPYILRVSRRSTRVQQWTRGFLDAISPMAHPSSAGTGERQRSSSLGGYRWYSEDATRAIWRGIRRISEEAS